jgi:hypothetical protein
MRIVKVPNGMRGYFTANELLGRMDGIADDREPKPRRKKRKAQVNGADASTVTVRVPFSGGVPVTKRSKSDA